MGCRSVLLLLICITSFIGLVLCVEDDKENQVKRLPPEPDWKRRFALRNLERKGNVEPIFLKHPLINEGLNEITLNPMSKLIPKHRKRHMMRNITKRFHRWRHPPSTFKCPPSMRMDRLGNCRYMWF